MRVKNILQTKIAQTSRFDMILKTGGIQITMILFTSLPCLQRVTNPGIPGNDSFLNQFAALQTTIFFNLQTISTMSFIGNYTPYE